MYVQSFELSGVQDPFSMYSSKLKHEDKNCYPKTFVALSSEALVQLYCAQKETHIFNVAISNELFD